MLKLGETGVSALYLGDAKIKKAYLGSELVFEEKKPSRLPAGYTELEYVYPPNNTSAYSNLGAYLSNGVLDMDITVTETLTGTCDIFYCNQYSSSKNYFVAIEARKTGFWIMSYPGAVNTTASPVQLTTSIPPGDYHIHVDVPNKTVSINNVTAAIPTMATANANSQVGAYLDKSGSNKIRFRECIITNTANTANSRNMHLVPCKNSAGKVGFYDLYRGSFYGPGNTNYPWAAGPAV